jgi:tetratricopeptide (TPR) repeat protein
MKRSLLFFLFLFGLLSSSGQSNADSLKRALLLATDTAKANLLIQLATINVRNAPKEALAFGMEALKHSEELNFETGIAKSYRAIAIAFFWDNNHSKSIAYLTLSTNKAIALNSWELAAQNHLNQAALYASVFGNYSKAMEYYTKALSIQELHAGTSKIYDSFGGIAGVYANQREYDKALEYYFKALAILESTTDRSARGVIYQNIGNVYVDMKDIKKAEQYYQLSLTEFEAIRNDGGRIVSLVKMSDVFRSRFQFDEALKNDQRAFAIADKMIYERGKFYVLESLGKTYLGKKDYVQSSRYLLQAIEVAARSRMLEKLMNSYELLAEVMTAQKNFERAFGYQKLQRLYADSVHSKVRTEQLAEMEIRFEMHGKEKENLLLKKDIYLKNVYAAIAVLIALLVGLFAFLVIRLQRIKNRSDKLIAAKSKELLEVELKNTQLSESQLKNMVEQKNKELTTYTLNLIQKNEMLEQLRATLEQIRTISSHDLSGKLNGIINSVNFSFHLDREWEGFKKHFEEVHGSFFERLRTQFPQLNMGDMKLCALLKLNLENKEIATILGISPDSTKVARHRLRKKLNLTTEQNLNGFLAVI